MAINKNHEFEDLDGVKCAIVEKNASEARVSFLGTLLEHNGYTVVVTASPPPKAPAAVAAAVAVNTEVQDIIIEPPALTFTIGVTNLMFNPTNAIMGRLLRTPDGKVVTQAYWEQREKTAHDEIPYYENKAE